MTSVKEVAAEHADAILALRPRGTAVINAGDAHANTWRAAARSAGAAVVDFGFHDWADVSARCTLRADGSDIELRTYAGNARVELHVPGRHMASNALAATAGALAARLPLDAIVRGLAAFRPVAGRLSALHAVSGALVIDDTYNANPDSVRAAIDVLAHAPGAKWLVLGDMGEVGVQGPAFHQEIGAYAKERGIERLFATGDLSRETRRRLRRRRRARRHRRRARRARAARRDGRRDGAGQRFALDADGARRGGAHRPGRRGERTDAGAARRTAGTVRARVQRVRLHHAARGAGDDDRAGHLVRRRPADDRVAHAHEDRPVGSRRRPADASVQGRHADDGRRADPGVDRRSRRCSGATSPTASSGSCCW